MENLSDKFQQYLQNPVFIEVLELVKQNSSGKIWIMGGYVYKNLASALYGIVPYEYDIDFLVEHKNDILKEVKGWRIETSVYNNPNYVRDTHKMSFTDLHKIIRVSGKTNYTVEEFILETPLNVQSIAYDVSSNILIGDIGMNALKEKVVRVNNLSEAEFYAHKKGKTVTQILEEKSKELDFQVEP